MWRCHKCGALTLDADRDKHICWFDRKKVDMIPNRRDESVTSDRIKNNETWNTCPKCLKDWKDPIPTPGLLHRTRTCKECQEKHER